MKAKALKRLQDENRFDSKTEREYFGRLRLLKMAGEIHDVYWEPFNLRLADRTYYKPDALVIENDGTLTIHEVKGYWREDARIKVKVAARQFPFLRFVAAAKRRKKDGGGWAFEEF